MEYSEEGVFNPKTGVFDPKTGVLNIPYCVSCFAKYDFEAIQEKNMFRILQKFSTFRMALVFCFVTCNS